MAQQNNNGAQDTGFWTRIMIVATLYFMLFSPSVPKASEKTMPPPYKNFLTEGTEIDMWVFISETNETFVPTSDALIWKEKSLIYGSWEDQMRKQSFMLKVTDGLRNNGSVYSHIYFTESGSSPIPGDASFKIPYINLTHPLTSYFPKTEIVVTKNLISGDSDKDYERRKKLEEENRLHLGHPRIVSHWKGNLTINLVTEFMELPRNAIPPRLLSHLKFDDSKNYYYPIIYGNDFWLFREDMIEINESIGNQIPLDITYEPISFLKWNLICQTEESLKSQMELLGTNNKEGDVVKRMLMDNDPYLLGFTFFISMVHMILDMLALKNGPPFFSAFHPLPPSFMNSGICRMKKNPGIC
eukprot:TRINITY_DN2953_c0_g2_i11.p1 TRINITY_DN2953_c0_g2~~TRINITY_DN2953_c0_g2_i11.p1  ORF type:complete len:356 (-),score=68.64 TRINITY_DN2953_c0_g2_i11:968-2035(-)